jgi:type III restriction enzyme
VLDEEARVWISVLQAVKAKIGVKVGYDLSATSFFFAALANPKTHSSPGWCPIFG